MRRSIEPDFESTSGPADRADRRRAGGTARIYRAEYRARRRLLADGGGKLMAAFSASASFSLGINSGGASREKSLAGTFNFRITLNRSDGSSPPLGDGGFQECSGLQIEMDVPELQEGGRNDGVVKQVGRGKYTSIVLKRGMLFPDGGTVVNELWSWIQDVLSGVRPVAR